MNCRESEHEVNLSQLLNFGGDIQKISGLFPLEICIKGYIFYFMFDHFIHQIRSLVFFSREAH